MHFHLPNGWIYLDTTKSLSLPIDRPSRHHGNPSFPRHHEALALTLLGTTSIVSDPPKASYLPTYLPTSGCNNLAYSCSACSRSLGWNTVANYRPANLLCMGEWRVHTEYVQRHIQAYIPGPQFGEAPMARQRWATTRKRGGGTKAKAV